MSEQAPMPTPTRTCDCELCKFHRRVKATIDGQSVEQLIALITEMEDGSMNLGHELEYLQCVFDGSWPNSVEILERALAKAIEKRQAAPRQ